MVEVCWSSLDGQDCIRLKGPVAPESVAVRPTMVDAEPGVGPMAGSVVSDGEDLCFVPRFALLGDTSYSVYVDDVETARLHRRGPTGQPTTDVLEIHPTAGEVPRNLLRLYVTFSAPMGEGQVHDHVSIVDENGAAIDDAILPGEYELWSSERTRLTILFDPARIKRGLVAHREIGYPLVAGRPFEVVVDAGFRDAHGLPLRSGASRRYEVTGDERRRVDPDRWRLREPTTGSVGELRVSFSKPLDHGLLGRCLRVVGPGGHPVDGTSRPGTEERSWAFRPTTPWVPGEHQLVVDTVLEDVAGNSVNRVFDRDLTRPEDEPRLGGPVTLSFSPLPPRGTPAAVSP